MADDDGLFDRLRARLAPTQDGSASPQARDERPTVVGREEYREEVDEQQIETFVTEYYRNPLVRVPVQNFASDVTEPGVSVDVAPRDDDGDIPTVEYDGRDRPLDEALSAWASSCFIDGFRFDGDFADLLEEAVKDRRGRRGTSIVEHAYDDPRERERLLGLKPLKTETVTAYTREGKAIVLRPDDDPGSFDTVAVRDYGDAVRDEAPMTPAGKTAAIAQFDDVFGAQEREEIPFALDDVTVSPHDADTGELFGRPDSSPVIERARALRKKLRYVDQSVVNTAFGNIIATVETQDAEVVKNVRDNLDVNVKDRGEDVDPETVSATNAAVDVTEVEGQVPDVVDIIQQEIEYVLSAMPTPLYRVGFAGDINRDVTSEQGQDYRDAVKRERRRLEADFTDILERKARELLHGDAHADEALDVDVSLRIRPEASESPLRDEEFDAGEFGELMSALSTAAGPKGGATEIIPEDVIIETLLDMDPETVQEAAPGDGDAPPITPPDGLSDAELEAFADFTDADLPALLAEDDGLFADNPIIPDGTTTLTVPLLQQWAAWVAAGRPEVEALRQWNPALHPRDPETGQFVERSFDVPESDIDVIQSGDPARLLRFIGDSGSRSDIEAVLQDDAVTIDGIPDDIDTNRGLIEHISETDPEERIPPSARVGDSGTAEMFDDEFTGEESVSLLDADGPAAERRAATDTMQRGQEIPGELIKSKQVPEGEDILVDEGDRVVPRTVRGYSRPGDTEHPVIDAGAKAVDPDEVDGIYRAAPRAKAELSFDRWPDRYAERKRLVEDAVQNVVPRGQNDAADRTISGDDGRKTPEIDDATFDRAADRIASVLGDADQETAETVIARLQSIGDDLDRAHAGDRPGENRPRSFMDISEGEPQSTIKHELGHVMASALGFGAVDAGASRDMNFYPAEDDDIDLSGDGDPISSSGITMADDPVEQFTVGYSNGFVADARGVEDEQERTSVGRSEWEDKVREEIPDTIPDLGPRNFRNADDEYLLEADEEDMIRTDGPAAFGRHLSITEIDDDPTGVADREFVAVAEDGTEYEFTVRDSFGEVAVNSKTVTDDPSRESTVFRTAGKRQSTPDAWGDSEPDTPDPDEVLGGDAADTPEGRMREFVSAANRAWFRANLMANQHDKNEALRFSVRSGYSTTSAHETIAQTVEMMHASSDKQRDVNTTAARLVRNNPELIEAYRHIADIPDPMRSAINEELDAADAEFRLGETDE